jgi:hypothetical protein
MVTTHISSVSIRILYLCKPVKQGFEYIMSGNRRGTLMRYFLFLSFPVALLSGGIIEAPSPACLILPGCTFQRLHTGIGCTFVGAIPMTPVTPGTDDDLCLTTATKIQAGSAWHRKKSR